MQRVGMGGSCHWCTEAILQCLRGVREVMQGFLSALPPDDQLSEGVLIDGDPKHIDLPTLVEVHLRTHSCTSAHAWREKYRSAVYVFGDEQKALARETIDRLQSEFDRAIITRVLRYASFEPSLERYRNYYRTDPDRPFCRSNIGPKLQIIRERFKQLVGGGEEHDNPTRAMLLRCLFGVEFHLEHEVDDLASAHFARLQQRAGMLCPVKIEAHDITATEFLGEQFCDLRSRPCDRDSVTSAPKAPAPHAVIQAG